MISSSLVLLLAVVSCIHSYELTQPESLTVRPDATLTINCKVSYSVTSSSTVWIRQPAGKTLEWIGMIWNGGMLYYKDSLKSKFSITTDTYSNTITMQGNNMQAEDTAVYYCAREYYGAFDYWGKGTAVTVRSAQTSAPKSIFAMSQCSSDSEFLTVGCVTRGFSPADSLTFKWTDPAKKDLTDFVQYPAFGSEGDYTKISHLRVKKSDWNFQKPYTCEASNSAGKKETHLPLAPPPPAPDHPATVYLTVPTKKDLENGTATFLCLAQQFSPKTYSFKWFKDEKQVTNAINTYDTSEKNGSVTLYSATSILKISAEEWKKASVKIKCEFELNKRKEVREAEYTDNGDDCSNIAVVIVPPSLEDMLKNREGTLTCKASGESPGFTKIEIKANNFVIAEASGAHLKNKIKVELEAPIGYEEWSNGTVFTCTVEHPELPQPMETTFKRENGASPKRPSVYLLAPPEHREGETMTLTCYVKDFYPKEVFVSWLADDEPVTLKSKTSLPVQNDEYFSVYSQITVSYSEWKSGIVYSCVVFHESIDEKMRVLTRSIDDHIDKPGVINLSMNTPACCKD